DRDHVHGVGMRDDVVSRLRDSANDLAMTLRHDARDDHGRLDVLARERIEHAEDPAAMAVLRKADGIEVGHAGLERISHRADAGPMAVRPALERAPKEHRQSLAARPPKIRRQRCLRGAGVYTELTHLTILSVDPRRLTNSDIFCYIGNVALAAPVGPAGEVGGRALDERRPARERGAKGEGGPPPAWREGRE